MSDLTATVESPAQTAYQELLSFIEKEKLHEPTIIPSEKCCSLYWENGKLCTFDVAISIENATPVKLHLLCTFFPKNTVLIREVYTKAEDIIRALFPYIIG